MKTCRIGILTICLILPVFLGSTRTEAPKNVNIPSQISVFYEDYNFISSFSTSTERRRLIGCMGEAEIPKDLKCQRLENVLTRLKKLRQMMLVNDSEMVIWQEGTGSFFGFHFRPVLFIVGDIQLFEEKALVEVRSYELEPDMILHFIAEYDTYSKDSDEDSSPEGRIKMVKARAPNLEIHRWCFQNEKWMKSAADLFFLDEKN
ncbi:hypothetical protein ACFLT2_05080 [Acidobacteriota bacterium]